MAASRVNDPLGSAPTDTVSIAVSTVIFALRSDDGVGADTEDPTIWLPLVRRIREPFDGRWALPGGPLDEREGLTDAAARSLSETTGLAPRYLEQLYAFGDVDRSPDGRVVSIVYWALVDSAEARRALVGQNVRWFPADRLPRLAFDHNAIVEYAVRRLRTKVEYSDIARALLGETFTLSELRSVHEAVLQRRLDPANFRRQVDSGGHLEPTGEMRRSGAHRPARLYRYADPLARSAAPMTEAPSPYPTTPEAPGTGTRPATPPRSIPAQPRTAPSYSEKP